jgi:hypothetical protein
LVLFVCPSLIVFAVITKNKPIFASTAYLIVLIRPDPPFNIITAAIITAHCFGWFHIYILEIENDGVTRHAVAASNLNISPTAFAAASVLQVSADAAEVLGNVLDVYPTRAMGFYEGLNNIFVGIKVFVFLFHLFSPFK